MGFSSIKILNRVEHVGTQRRPIDVVQKARASFCHTLPHKAFVSTRTRNQCNRPSLSRNLTTKVRCDQPSGIVAPTSKAGLIFAPSEGSWDKHGIGSPIVNCFLGDNEQRWFMWYTGWDEAKEIHSVVPSAGKIGVATSVNGVEWERGSPSSLDKENLALDASEDWWTFDTCNVAVSDVQILSNSSVGEGVGVYWMFYTGGSYEDAVTAENMPGVDSGRKIEGLRMRPGLAMSQDGQNWARIEGQHYSGSLFEVGEDGEWDSLYIASPQVLNVAPKDMRMYYHSFDTSRKKYSIGLAKSENGFEWTKSGMLISGGEEGALDSQGAASQCVVKDTDNNQFLMFYEGVGNANERSIWLAVSKDGISNWERCPEPVLALSSEEGAWDGGGVGSPWAVSMADGKWRLYYAGKAKGSDGWRGIGLALSTKDGKKFKGVPIEFKRRMPKAD